ncbi:unnamed protein product [Blumeria hordei]|uniref:CRAL-TRIO domain-containing protein n=2 Tax=Blumeria hordei TaxID=2867405 RepID=A0A383UST7_BLUHO|nr:CRAL/TRIO domain containing protein [Blumeria hordei DH14]SZF03423.1 unnamed protein product [Blumeria hordei]
MIESAEAGPGYPHGHLGHLTTEQELALTGFKLLCEEKGYYEPLSPSSSASHDDATLLRFLRARRFDIASAVEQFIVDVDWRKLNSVCEIYETIDLQHYEEARRIYPQWTGRCDRRGIPVYLFEVKHLTSQTMADYENSSKKTFTTAQTDNKTSSKLLRLFALYENLTRFTMPLCTTTTDRPYPDTPITQSSNIVDISGLGLRQFWNLREHMLNASTLATAHYPETLDRIFIIGAPSFFPTVWSWIKKWFDVNTTSKIFIISAAETQKTLEAFIEPQNLPKKYGGELEFQYGDLPKLHANMEENISWEGDYSSFPGGPMYWIENDETLVAYAAGSSSGAVRNGKICTIQKTIKTQSEKTTHLGHSLGTARPKAFTGAKEIAPLSSEKALLATSNGETCDSKLIAIKPEIETLDLIVPDVSKNNITSGGIK